MGYFFESMRKQSIPLTKVVLVLLYLAVTYLGCYGKYTLGFPGPYPVAGFHTHVAEDQPITVFYPDTDPPLEHCPVVIFSAGFIQPRASYEGFARQLAQWGYVAVIRTYPSLGFAGFGDALLDTHVAQVQGLIDWLAEQNDDSNSPLFRKVDATNVGLTGHSLGATVSICAGLADPRVRAVVSLDVTYNGGDFDVIDELPFTNVAFMYIAASAAGWCSRAPGARDLLYDYTPSPTVLVTLEGADHMDFMDTPIGIYYLGNVACPQGPADGQVVRDLATKYMVSWFNVYLKGREEFADYYSGAQAAADEAANLAHFRCRLQ
ncbi:MAG TPA: hypothetical protein PKY35_13655 [Candidatus Hydrogenedentes bacterium]|nr:hypothetical protein [Candidatus Hydrogenedentota bacterium]HOL78065.1 hypothetical protein [Candidatus Hydrogenedentota bacterium]